MKKQGRKIAPEAMTDNWAITADPADVRDALDRAREAGFDEVEIHSASPDQAAFVDMMTTELLDRY